MEGGVYDRNRHAPPLNWECRLRNPKNQRTPIPTPARARGPTIRRLYVGLVQAFPAPQQEIDLDQGKEKRAGRDWGKLQTGERGRTKLVHD
jgi:hypothetical protein